MTTIIAQPKRGSAGHPSPPPTVAVSAVNHYFGAGDLRKQALYDNDLRVWPGEIVIMTGPSGSGKTTLLTLIGTLRTVMEGSLKVLGQELNGANTSLIARLRMQMGFIFQAHNLFGSLSAYENVNMAAELVGMNRRAADERIKYLLGRLGLGEHIHKKPKQLSGGQKQRVAIARGLVHSPRLVLADEPTAALDAVSGREVVTLFRELTQDQEDPCTIIMVTHDNRILDVADRIVNMVDGEILSDVSVEEAEARCQFLRNLKHISSFADLTPSTLLRVADKMRVEEAQPGDVVIRQGDPGDLFYIIRSGRVDVVVERDGRKQTVASLGEGQYFGEAALITGEPRNATIIATEPSVFYTLDKDRFQRTMQTTPSLGEELRRALFSR